MAPSWPVPQRLAVGRGHRMAWRGVGDPGGEPWLLLHGGPGSGAQPGLLAPLAGADPSLNLPLLALSIGCGSLFFNYANHAGFWMVKESFGMTMSEATKTISVVQSIVAVVGLVMVLIFNAVVTV